MSLPKYTCVRCSSKNAPFGVTKKGTSYNMCRHCFYVLQHVCFCVNVHKQVARIADLCEAYKKGRVMRAVLVRYEKKFNLGNYESESFAIELALEENEKATVAFDNARKLVDKYKPGVTNQKGPVHVNKV